MDRDTARQEIRERIDCKRYLEKSKKSGLFNCPFCGSGKGKNATGALKLYKTNTWTCHACGKSGDVIDLYQNATGADFFTALFMLGQEIGIEIETGADKGKNRQATQTAPNSPIEGQTTQKDINVPSDDKNPNTGRLEGDDLPSADFREYYKKCRDRLNDPSAISYLSARGIDIKTAEAAWIGFDPEADPANAPGAMGNEHKPHPCLRLIIPTTRAHYVGRRIDGQKEFDKVNAKGSTPGIFNKQALYAQDVQEVFITEGAFDALSVLEAGGAAIALNSANNAEMLIKSLERRRTGATLILCLDNDQAGEKAGETLKEGLARLEIPFLTADICNGAKDPNEALTADRAEFFKAVQEAKEKAMETTQNAREVQEVTTASDYLSKGIYEKDIAYFKEYKDRKMGLHRDIDRYLTLYPGLAVLGGASSLGKTTFITAMIDKLLDRGETVLFFSLEQLPIEIITKSLTRKLSEIDPATRLTNIDIKNGATCENLERVKRAYIEHARNYHIIPGDFRTTAADISETVKDFREKHGGENCRPIVIVDYLQLIAPPAGFRGGIRETIDENIKALKLMQLRNRCFVIVVSSFNRSSNYEPVSYESFKETGMIEFTCDYVWGLQLSILDAENEDFYTVTGVKGGKSERPLDQKKKLVNKAQAETPKKVEFVSLKNRNGKQFFKAFFDYRPSLDLFTETTEAGGQWVDGDPAVFEKTQRV